MRCSLYFVWHSFCAPLPHLFLHSSVFVVFLFLFSSVSSSISRTYINLVVICMLVAFGFGFVVSHSITFKKHEANEK